MFSSSQPEIPEPIEIPVADSLNFYETKSEPTPDSDYLEPEIRTEIEKLLEDRSSFQPPSQPFECCVCLETREPSLAAPIPCCHPLCTICAEQLQTPDCPICRRPLRRLDLGTKIAVFCLGDPTDKCVFENGGYENCALYYFPPRNFLQQELFEGVKYHEHNYERKRLIDRFYQLATEGVSIVFQHHIEVLQYLGEVEIESQFYFPW